ncbi:MAG: multicopper oxidase family protein [Clostridia bacterium]
MSTKSKTKVRIKYNSKTDSLESNSTIDYIDKMSEFCNINPSNPNTIPKFMDELPKPPVLRPWCSTPSETHYSVEMRRALHRFHKFFPFTNIWGYEGTYPGPTIETTRDQKVMIKWVNNLPQKHFLPIDRTLHSTADTPEVRTVVHLHGANVNSDSDGHPDAWFTKNYEKTGHAFSREVYEYTNHQQATTLWYHDHAVGITRLNVYAGLAGFYIIRDTLEPRLELPCGEYEMPLLIQDKSFNEDGSLFYPDKPPFPVLVSPSVVPAFIGNTIVVNGKVWPYLNIEPRKYRFRLLNASNTRTYTLSLSNGHPFYQIGSDGGLLSNPVKIETLTIAPSERADLIIDFSEFSGEYITLVNNDTDPNTSIIMQFRVILPQKEKDTSKIPETLYPVMPIEENLASCFRNITLDATTDKYRRPLLLLDNHMWHDPATEMPELDTIEVWNLVNLTNFAHPIHIHLVQFQILDRRPFDVERYRETREIIYTGAPIEPDENEKGWKDTVRVNAGQVTRIIAHFKDFIGSFVYHCHILEHEDHDMMRPLKVITKYNS